MKIIKMVQVSMVKYTKGTQLKWCKWLVVGGGWDTMAHVSFYCAHA